MIIPAKGLLGLKESPANSAGWQGRFRPRLEMSGARACLVPTHPSRTGWTTARVVRLIASANNLIGAFLGRVSLKSRATRYPEGSGGAGEPRPL